MRAREYPSDLRDAYRWWRSLTPAQRRWAREQAAARPPRKPGQALPRISFNPDTSEGASVFILNVAQPPVEIDMTKVPTRPKRKKVPLGFQDRFEAALVIGTKTQTIRKKRNNPPRPRDEIRGYLGWRTKKSRLIFTGKVTEVRDISISELTEQDAMDDGFMNLDELRNWFVNTYKLKPEGMEAKDFILIRWKLT